MARSRVNLRSSQEFLTRLKIQAKNPERLVDFIFWRILKLQDIPLSKPESQDIRYTLMSCRTPMCHGDEEANFHGFFLQYLSEKKTTMSSDTRDWKTLSISSATDCPTSNKTIEAMVVPLGWLVENGIQPKHMFKRVTNYAVLLNISSGSISLWLAYWYNKDSATEQFRTLQSRIPFQDPRPTQCKTSIPFERKRTDCPVRREILQAFGLEVASVLRMKLPSL